MENKNHIGTKLFKIRNERGETQEHVAECVGITYVSLSRYENGQRMPKMDILARLAEHYGVTVHTRSVNGSNPFRATNGSLET